MVNRDSPLLDSYIYNPQYIKGMIPNHQGFFWLRKRWFLHPVPSLPTHAVDPSCQSLAKCDPMYCASMHCRNVPQLEMRTSGLVSAMQKANAMFRISIYIILYIYYIIYMCVSIIIYICIYIWGKDIFGWYDMFTIFIWSFICKLDVHLSTSNFHQLDFDRQCSLLNLLSENLDSSYPNITKISESRWLKHNETLTNIRLVGKPTSKEPQSVIRV